MRVQRIMCAVDFTESSTAALDDAASLALQLGAQLLIMHVDDHPLLSGAASPSLSRCITQRREQLESTLPHVSGVPVEHLLVRGKAVDEIPRFARVYNVDLVVMGREHVDPRFQVHHDRLCHVVAQRCSCPVMTITHVAARIPWAC